MAKKGTVTSNHYYFDGEKVGITGRVTRRTFAAKDFSVGSPIRKRLNEETLTSEYYTTKKWLAEVNYPETDKTNACTLSNIFKTRKEAKEYINEKMNKK